MSVLTNDPVIFWSVVAGLAFLIVLKVTAFLVVRRVMVPKAKKEPTVPRASDIGGREEAAAADSEEGD